MLAGRASPFSQTTAADLLLAARCRKVSITCSVALVTTIAAANVTRLPPVRAGKRNGIGIADQSLHPTVVDTQQLRGDIDHGGTRAADIRMTPHYDHGAR